MGDQPEEQHDYPDFDQDDAQETEAKDHPH